MDFGCIMYICNIHTYLNTYIMIPTRELCPPRFNRLNLTTTTTTIIARDMRNRSRRASTKTRVGPPALRVRETRRK